jgi:hypothetical protein
MMGRSFLLFVCTHAPRATAIYPVSAAIFEGLDCLGSGVTGRSATAV